MNLLCNLHLTECDFKQMARCCYIVSLWQVLNLHFSLFLEVKENHVEISIHSFLSGIISIPFSYLLYSFHVSLISLYSEYFLCLKHIQKTANLEPMSYNNQCPTSSFSIKLPDDIGYTYCLHKFSVTNLFLTKRNMALFSENKQQVTKSLNPMTIFLFLFHLKILFSLISVTLLIFVFFISICQLSYLPMWVLLPLTMLKYTRP